MDAIEFVKQLRRMDANAHRKHSIYLDSPEDVVAEVEEWAKKNPVKTRQSVFLKHFPEAELTKDGVISICPVGVSAAYRDDHGYCANPSRHCADCRKEYWTQEVKEDD